MCVFVQPIHNNSDTHTVKTCTSAWTHTHIHTHTCSQAIPTYTHRCMSTCTHTHTWVSTHTCALTPPTVPPKQLFCKAAFVLFCDESYPPYFLAVLTGLGPRREVWLFLGNAVTANVYKTFRDSCLILLLTLISASTSFGNLLDTRMPAQQQHERTIVITGSQTILKSIQCYHSFTGNQGRLIPNIITGGGVGAGRSLGRKNAWTQELNSNLDNKPAFGVLKRKIKRASSGTKDGDIYSQH